MKPYDDPDLEHENAADEYDRLLERADELRKAAQLGLVCAHCYGPAIEGECAHRCLGWRRRGA